MNSLTHLDRLLARSLSPPPPPPAAAPPPLPPVRPELDAALASAAANGSVGGDGQDDTLPVASSSRSVPPSPAGPRDVGLPPTTATRRRAISGTSSPSLSVLLVSPSSPSSLASNPLGAASPTLSAVKRRRSTSARTASQQQQQQQAPARWLLARVLARLWAVLVALALWGSGGKRAMLAFGAGTGGPGARGRAATVGKRPAARRRAAAGAALKGRSPGTGSSTESDVPGPSSSTATRGAPSTPDDAPFPDPRTQAVDPALVLQSPGAPADGPAAPAALHQPALPTPTFALLPPPAAASQDDDEASAQAAAPLRSRLLTNPLGSTTLLRPASSLLSPSSFSATPSSLPPTPPLLSPPSAGRPSPAARKTTPFHKPKTLILDLDETLIHSTSRPMSALAPGSSGGSGGQGGLGRWGGGGGRGRGEGHMVEVFLGGRSTVYHVYKRPYVDYFLKKVRLASARSLSPSCLA